MYVICSLFLEDTQIMKKSFALLLAVLMLVASLTTVLTSCGSGDDDPGANIHLFLSYRIYDLDPTLAIVDDEAAQILSSIPESDRGAEWHFLMGCVAVNRGHFVDAQQFFDTACGMDPGNAEYRDAQERLRNRSSEFGSGAGGRSSSCSCCDVCAAFMCADCCCDMGRCCC